MADYLRRPRWGVTVNLNHFPLAPVPEIARNLGFPMPADFKLDGMADGAVGYSMPENSPRMDGTMSVANSTLIVAGAPPLHIAGARLHFSGSVVTLEATEVVNENKETAAIAGSWDAESRELGVELSSDGMSIASLRRQISIAGIPLLSRATSGTWKGDLRYRDEAWRGDVNLQDADIPFEAFTEPLHVISADATIDGAGLSLKRVNLSIGGLRAEGEYRYEALAPRPHRFHITVAEAEWSRDREVAEAHAAARELPQLRVQFRAGSGARLAAEHARRRNHSGGGARSRRRAFHEVESASGVGGDGRPVHWS